MSNIAHTKNLLGKRQNLEEHLRNVADAAGRYSASFGSKAFAHYAGLMHDIGKYDPAFQQYLLNAEQNPAKGMRGPDHKGAGTVLAQTVEARGLLAFLFLLTGIMEGLQPGPTLKPLFWNVGQIRPYRTLLLQPNAPYQSYRLSRVI